MMDRDILTQIAGDLDSLKIKVLPLDEHYADTDDGTDKVDYTFNTLQYRGLEIGQVRYFEHQPNVAKIELISKIALGKRQRPYLRFTDVPSKDYPLMDAVLTYAVPIYRDHMPQFTFTCPGHYWKFKAFHDRTKEALVTMLKNVAGYVDHELEEDPSKVNGWNFVTRMKQFIEHERALMADVDCIRRKDIKLPSALMDTVEGTLENGHKYAAILVHDDGKEHRCHAIHTYKADGDGMYCVLNTYKFRYEDLFVMKPTHMVGLVQLRKMYMDYSAKE